MTAQLAATDDSEFSLDVLCSGSVLWFFQKRFMVGIAFSKSTRDFFGEYKPIYASRFFAKYFCSKWIEQTDTVESKTI